MTDESPQTAVPLDVVQRWFQAVIFHPGGVLPGLECAAAQAELNVTGQTLAEWILPSQQLSAERRLGIYANAYFARLLECLRAEFPLLTRAAGREGFDGLALGYLLAHPSQSYTLNRLGASLAAYLAETRPPQPTDAGEPKPDWADLLVDLAQLEWAIGEVFDGPGSEARPRVLDQLVIDLASLGNEASAVQLQTCPSLRLLTFRFPLNDYYNGLKSAAGDGAGEASDGTAEVDVSPPEPAASYLALLRRDFVVWRYPISAAQWALLDSLQRGETLGQAVAAAAERWPVDGSFGAPEDTLEGSLGRWFRDWAAAGFFVSIRQDTTGESTPI